MTHSNSVRVRGAKECIIYDYQIHFLLVKVLPRKNIDRFWIWLNNFLGIFSFYLIIICLINTLWDGIGDISSQNYDKVLIFYWTSKFMKISCAKVQFIVYTKQPTLRTVFFFLRCQNDFQLFMFVDGYISERLSELNTTNRRPVVENDLIYSEKS